MKLTFKSENGILSMSGSGKGEYLIKTITGLGVLNRNYECISYYNSDGKTTLSSYLGSRIITISGDIFYCNNSVIKKTVKILNCPGVLTVFNSVYKKMINYKPLSFELGERFGHIQNFAFQIECDFPYFEDILYTQNDIYTKTNNITSPFTLPAVFSTRKNVAEITNNGDEKTFPIIKIFPASKSNADGTYVLKNLTTGSSITFKITCESGETITVDTSKRTITSDKTGNLIHCLKEGALSNFYLAKGKNEITCLCDNADVSPAGILLYKNYYWEAL